MASQLGPIMAGIAAQIRTVAGLKNVITHYPNQVGPYPMVFLYVDSADYPETTYGEMTIGYRPEGYLVLAPIGANAEAVADLGYALIPEIIEALGHDMDAGGAIVDGQMMLEGFAEGRMMIGKVDYHVRRLRFRVIERRYYEYSP